MSLSIVSTISRTLATREYEISRERDNEKKDSLDNDHSRGCSDRPEIMGIEESTLCEMQLALTAISICDHFLFCQTKDSVWEVNTNFAHRSV